jgi:chromatin segregation and condensation protein Rec8/ScpA/Scc1 (kleisin family)
MVFEGPLDLLLKLARDQKVDLTRISILALAEQYLAFIEAGAALALEIAADYLVMAAWLAFLKSGLLLPERGGGRRAKRRGTRRPSWRAACAAGSPCAPQAGA